MAARPTAVISYSHETPEHDERVLQLSERLRADGVACVIDAYEVSPPEGWPAWMRRQVQERDFCIVVCTATYARRFAGDESSGTGKGASWEGQLIRQLLYESGKNNRVIPVVFDAADVEHIPLELKGATRYDVGTAEGYSNLHRALTGQPRVEPSDIGSVRTHLPFLAAAERDAVALLGVCPDPLPIDVLARAGRQTIGDLANDLIRLVDKNHVAIEDGFARLQDRSVAGVPSPSGEVLGVALEVLLDFIKRHHREPIARHELMNAVTLARAADAVRFSAQVSRAFTVLHPLLKARGDKRLVLDLARRSIEASKAPTRGTEQAQDEAVALVCGVSWVYQRTGRLEESRIEAERSLQLGIDIGWDRNTAFCKKCLGRLKRMEAEVCEDNDRRKTLLRESEELLHDAVARFSTLAIETEVGDCYSLLARTYLVANQIQEAKEAIRQAEARLLESGTKDYLDLQIVKGDLMLHTNRRSAEDFYTDVLAEAPGDDAQKSEIFARAYLHRGRVRAALGAAKASIEDFRKAAEIWDALDDPSADLANWEIEKSANWLDKDALGVIGREPVAIRVRVAQMVRERVAARPTATAKRPKLPEQYLRDLVRQAKEKVAIERPDW